MRKHILISFLVTVASVFVAPAANAAHFPTFERQISSPPPLNSSHFGFSFNEFNGNVLVGAPGINSAAYLVDISTGDPLLTLTSPDAGDGAISFGGSVAQTGQSIVVGDNQYDDGPIVRTGSAYVFDGSTGQNLFTIRNPDPQDFDNFAASVQSVAGQLWINSESSSTGRAGQVYVFDPTNGDLLDTLANPEPGSGSWGFGHRFLERQSSAFISAPGAPVAGESVGAVYRYDTATLTQTLKIPNPSGQEGAFFGWSLAVSSSQLLVGARNFSSPGVPLVGQAYLFDADSGALLRTFSNPEPKDIANFGQSVALYGGYAFIGANADLNPGGSGPQNVGAFYVFDTATGAYLGRVVNPAGGQNDRFSDGNSGLTVIGDRLAVASYLDGNGNVYLYSVPEPSAASLFALGLLGALIVRGRRMQRLWRTQ